MTLNLYREQIELYSNFNFYVQYMCYVANNIKCTQ